jgi:hypothetical protein
MTDLEGRNYRFAGWIAGRHTKGTRIGKINRFVGLNRNRSVRGYLRVIGLERTSLNDSSHGGGPHRRIGLACTAVTPELGPDSFESGEWPVVIQGKPDNVLLSL